MTRNTDADYEVRLKDRCEQWEQTHRTQAAEMRLVVQRRLGMIQPPRPGSIAHQVLEREFREDVRKLHPKWPTLRQFLRGES